MNKHSKAEITEEEIIGELYIKHKNAMHKEANKILKDHFLAEDAMQQAFLKILNNLDKVDVEDEKRSKNFFTIVTRNIAIDIYKKRLYLNNNSESIDYEMIDESDDAPVDYKEPADIVINKETVNKISEAIGKLPAIYRDVMLLEKVHNKTKEEIADILNISYENVRKRSFRARKMILEILEKEDIK